MWRATSNVSRKATLSTSKTFSVRAGGTSSSRNSGESGSQRFSAGELDLWGSGSNVLEGPGRTQRAKTWLLEFRGSEDPKRRKTYDLPTSDVSGRGPVCEQVW